MLIFTFCWDSLRFLECCSISVDSEVFLKKNVAREKKIAVELLSSGATTCWNCVLRWNVANAFSRDDDPRYCVSFVRHKNFPTQRTFIALHSDTARLTWSQKINDYSLVDMKKNHLRVSDSFISCNEASKSDNKIHFHVQIVVRCRVTGWQKSTISHNVTYSTAYIQCFFTEALVIFVYTFLHIWKVSVHI